MKKRNFILLVFLLLIGFVGLVACGDTQDAAANQNPATAQDAGAKGEIGDQGPVGEQGPKGETGLTGETGDQGPTGIDGQDGEIGVDGTDATNSVLSIDKDGIKYNTVGSEEESMLVIAWDDLFSYTRTYTVTLGLNGGTVEGGDTELEGLIYKEAVSLPIPTHETYDFLGWKDDEGNVVENSTIESLEQDVMLTAAWKATIYLEDIAGASALPFVALMNEDGTARDDADIVADIKVKFLTDYCVAMAYDETKTAEVVALAGEDLFEELKLGFVDGGVFFTLVNIIETTDLCDNYLWMFHFIYTSHNSRWTSGGEIKRSDIRFDGRATFFDNLLMNHEITSETYYSTWSTSVYTMPIIVMSLVNFLDATEVNYGGGSIDKLISFSIENKKTWNDGGDEVINDNFNVYANLPELLKTGLEPITTLFEGDAYILPELSKEGATFDGWVDADGNAVTAPATVDNNSQTFTATWTADAE